MGVKGNHSQTSVVMRTEHLERLNLIIEQEGIPSRNALIQAIAATITREEARRFYDLAVNSGAMRKGTTAEEREAREALAKLPADKIMQLLASNT